MRVVKLIDENYSSNSIKWNGGVVVEDYGEEVLIELCNGEKIVEYWHNLDEIREEWKDVPNYEGLYIVSNFGRYKALAKTYQPGVLGTPPRYKAEHFLKYGPHRDGYLTVCFSNNGKSKTTLAHKLVAKLWCDNPQNKPEVNHKDGIKQNLFYFNLEWNTRSENILHSFATGLHKKRKLGEHPAAKLVLDLQTGIFYDCVKEAAIAKGISHHTAINHLSGVTKVNATGLMYV